MTLAEFKEACLAITEPGNYNFELDENPGRGVLMMLLDEISDLQQGKDVVVDLFHRSEKTVTVVVIRLPPRKR